MTRAERRRLEKESKTFKKLIKTIKHFFKNFFEKLNEVEDHRNQSYIKYEVAEILTAMLLGHIMNLKSMNNLSYKFNKEECIENMKKILEKENIDEIPHYDTINAFLEYLPPEELEKIRKYMIKELFKKRCFDNFRYMAKYWMIAVDGTGIQTFKERHCEHCLKKTHKNKKTGEETTTYYHNVLEAKLIVGDMALSIATVFIENEDENVKKQDCERKAFKRLAAKLKADFPKLPIVIVGDSLYANEPFMTLCKNYDWQWIIRFKEGSIKTVAEEFRNLIKLEEQNSKQTNKDQCERNYRWVNGISYKSHELNILELEERKKEGELGFIFISSIKITAKNVIIIAEFGRNRWKIENQGFKNQKKHGYELEHVFSYNYNAMQNHYFLVQIAHIIRQLYEKGVKLLKQVKNTLENISFELLESFRKDVLTDKDLKYIKKRNQIRLL